MDKNYKQKVKSFFKKEGFYLVLFLCLCIITAIATLSFKKSNDKEQASKIENTQEVENIQESQGENMEGENGIALENNANVNTEMQNAERANIESNDEALNEAQAVTSTTEVSFVNPVDGKLLRDYTYPKPVKFNETTQRTIRGVDINAAIGTEVKAAAEGIVERAENAGVEDGVVVVIKHANGMKTKYCNLSEDLNVKKDDKVEAGKVIGKVGESAKLFNKDQFGEHLNLQVLTSENEQVNPLKYFKYSAE